MSSRLLKTKLPMVDKSISTEEAINRIVKELNSSFTPEPIEDGVDLEFFFLYTGGTQVDAVTLSHGLGSTPSGYFVKDFTSNYGPAGTETCTIIRTSWTTTQISFKITYQNAAGSAIYRFKIRVLR